MKGLIIKDFMVLRKNLIEFVMILSLSSVVAIMFILSAQYGNLASAKESLLADPQVGEFGLISMTSLALTCYLFVPMAAVADMSYIFREDGKAGFSSVAAVLPVTVRQRVSARYITILCTLVAGVIFDIFAALIISRMTELIVFGEMINMIFAVASFLMIYSSLCIFECILWGQGKEEVAMIVSTVIIMVVMVVCGYQKFKNAIFNNDDQIMKDIMELLKHKAYILVIIALVTLILSYTCSVAVANRKRGVI